MIKTPDLIRTDFVIELLEKTKNLFIKSRKPQLLKILKNEKVIVSRFEEKKFDKEYDAMSAFLTDFVEIIINGLKE